MNDICRKNFFIGENSRYKIVLLNEGNVGQNIIANPIDVSYYTICLSSHNYRDAYTLSDDDFTTMAREYFLEKIFIQETITEKSYEAFKKQCYGLYQNYYEANVICFMLNFLDEKGFWSDDFFGLNKWKEISIALNKELGNSLITSDIVYFFSSFLHWCSLYSSSYKLGRVKLTREFSFLPSFMCAFEGIEKNGRVRGSFDLADDLPTSYFLYFNINPNTFVFELDKDKTKSINPHCIESCSSNGENAQVPKKISLSNLKFENYDIVGSKLNHKSKHLFYGVWKFENRALCLDWDLGNYVNSFISDAVNPLRNGRVWYLISQPKFFNGIEFFPQKKSLVLAKNLVLFFEILHSNNIKLSQIDYLLICEICKTLKEEGNQDPRFINLFMRSVLSFFSWCFKIGIGNELELKTPKELLGFYVDISYSEDKTLNDNYHRIEFPSDEYISIYC